MRSPADNARLSPAGYDSNGAGDVSDGNLDSPSIPRPTDLLADIDAVAENLRGRFVVQVVIDAERGHRRTNVYRNCGAAERAVERARQRGQTAHVTLVQMLPVGVVQGVLR